MAKLQAFVTWLGLFGSLGIIMAENCPHVCQWLPWNPWEACSETCGGGRRVRSRPLCCNTEHTFDQCIAHCGISRDPTEWEDCNQICDNGGSIRSYGGCTCDSAYYGRCCENRYTCGDPGGIDNGERIGSSFYYGDRVQYRCNAGYDISDGSVERLCTTNFATYAYWSGTRATCTFVETCKSNPCQNGGECIDGWDMYTCHCLHGWTGTHCELDILPPEVENCSDNQTYIVTEERAMVNWSTPLFSDVRNSPLVETQNYPNPSSNFQWGEHAVQYTATKQTNGLRTECVFYVNVYPTPCNDTLVNPPYIPNGAVVCNGWQSHLADVCKVYCNEDWKVPRGESLGVLYVCGASGARAPKLGFDSCSDRSRKPPKRSKAEHYYSGECTSTEVQQYLAEQYIEHLNSSDFSELCTGSNECCSTDNVLIYCG